MSVHATPALPPARAEQVRPSSPPPRRPLRICHVSLTLKTGGLERLLADLARHHDPAATQMEFVAIQEIGRFAEIITAAGCQVHTLKKSRRIGHLRQLARLFRAGRFDVVHTHNTYPHLYATLAAKWAGVPVVVQTRHGQRAGHGWKSSLQYRWVARLVDRIIAVSHDAAALTVKPDGVPAGKVQTIWNGIDLDDFEYRGPCGRPVAVSVARLSAEKDFPTLLHAMKLAHDELPELKLRMVGDGPERGRLETLTRELGLTECVEFCGDCRNVPAQLADAALFVSSSLTEGISLTLLEAMAVGLPVVATAVGGNPEIVLQGETGRLVPPKNPRELADAMVDLARQPELWRRWGQAGRARVESQFDVRRMVADYEALYAEIVQSRSLARS